jgi:hypothetical protein
MPQWVFFQPPTKPFQHWNARDTQLWAILLPLSFVHTWTYGPGSQKIALGVRSVKKQKCHLGSKLQSEESRKRNTCYLYVKGKNCRHHQVPKSKSQWSSQFLKYTDASPKRMKTKSHSLVVESVGMIFFFSSIKLQHVKTQMTSEAILPKIFML